MIAYALRLETPTASTYATEAAAYGPASIAYRYAGFIPATTFYGICASGSCPDKKDLQCAAASKCGDHIFYPALPADGSLRGVAACEKDECIYVDFCSLTAFKEAGKPPDTPKLAVPGIYIDRRTKNAKYGLLYMYELYQPGASGARLVTATTAELPERVVLGYKKTYGWGRAAVERHCYATPPGRRRAFLLLSPVPMEALRNAVEKLGGWEGYRVKLGRWLIYLQATNRFYYVGNTPADATAMPLTEVVLKKPATVWEFASAVRQEVARLRVFKSSGAPASGEEAEAVLRKAAATAASPVVALYIKAEEERA